MGSPLSDARDALANAADVAFQMGEHAELDHYKAATLGFQEAIASAAVDLAVSLRILADREVQ